MRRSVVIATLACATVLAAAAPALADASSPAQAPTPASRSTTAPSPEPRFSTLPAPSSRAGQVRVLPHGAPDTGVPPVASSNGFGGSATGAALGGAVLVGGAGVLVLRRRSRAQG